MSILKIIMPIAMLCCLNAYAADEKSSAQQTERVQDENSNDSSDENNKIHVSAQNPFELTTDTQIPPQSDVGNELMKLLGSIALFTLVLLLLNWALRKINQNRQEQLNATSDVRVLEKRILSHKSMVYLINIRNKTIAIAESSAGIAKLAEFESTDLDDQST